MLPGVWRRATAVRIALLRLSPSPVDVSHRGLDHFATRSSWLVFGQRQLAKERRSGRNALHGSSWELVLDGQRQQDVRSSSKSPSQSQSQSQHRRNSNVAKTHFALPQVATALGQRSANQMG